MTNKNSRFLSLFSHLLSELNYIEVSSYNVLSRYNSDSKQKSRPIKRYIRSTPVETLKDKTLIYHGHNICFTKWHYFNISRGVESRWGFGFYGCRRRKLGLPPIHSLQRQRFTNYRWRLRHLGYKWSYFWFLFLSCLCYLNQRRRLEYFVNLHRKFCWSTRQYWPSKCIPRLDVGIIKH